MGAPAARQLLVVGGVVAALTERHHYKMHGDDATNARAGGGWRCPRGSGSFSSTIVVGYARSAARFGSRSASGSRGFTQIAVFSVVSAGSFIPLVSGLLIVLLTTLLFIFSNSKEVNDYSCDSLHRSVLCTRMQLRCVIFRYLLF